MKIKELTYERNYNVDSRRRSLVCVTNLYSSELRNFHLNEKCLSGDRHRGQFLKAENSANSGSKFCKINLYKNHLTRYMKEVCYE
jgi:hypothetical protein